LSEKVGFAEDHFAVLINAIDIAGIHRPQPVENEDTF
jgi:hypothetical protein